VAVLDEKSLRFESAGIIDAHLNNDDSMTFSLRRDGTRIDVKLWQTIPPSVTTEDR